MTQTRITVSLPVKKAKAIVQARAIMATDPGIRCALIGADIYQDLHEAVREIEEALEAAR